MTLLEPVRRAAIAVAAVLSVAVPAAAQTEAPKQELPAFIPPITDADRKVAFPDVDGHAVHDGALTYFVLFDQLEWQGRSDRKGLNIDSRGWVGRDRDRLWFRAEGDSDGGRVGEAQTHILYGRQISRWWDVVAGVRQDFRPGPAQTWAAIGIQGLAPYWFDIEATAYVGASGRTHARFEVEYELLLTNRLVLQPLFEAEIFGKSDPERGVGAGLSTTDLGFRLRYELKREIAPYVGVTWSNKWAKTADFAEAAGDGTDGARFVTGLRLWF
jgi:copper resistance protein B